MASKNKKAGRAAVPAQSGREEVERLLAKLRLKDAVHAAKLCYKQQSTPENHRLLERAYLLRADQLLRNGMPAAAEEVAQHLLDFGVTDKGLIDATAKLLTSLGMTRRALELQGRLDSPEARAELAAQEADLALLHPERAREAAPELLEEAKNVRRALELLQSGDEAGALAALQGVARSSPFSDWKLFVRGLAASHRGARDEAEANWGRLDPKRAAIRVARGVRGLGAGANTPLSRAQLVALQMQVFGEPLLDTLEQLRKLLAERRWQEALRRVASLRIRLRRIDIKLAERLTEVLQNSIFDVAFELELDEDEAPLREFTQVAEPLPIDPRWNRFWALAWEGPLGSTEEAGFSWKRYLQDLDTLAVLTAEERILAKALVCKHLGNEFRGDAKRWSRLYAMEPGEGPSPAEIREVRQKAIFWLEESIRLAPEHRESYIALAATFDEAKQPQAAASVTARLLEQFPDDTEGLSFLVHHHFQRNEIEPALEYLRRLRVQKPLDTKAARDEWDLRMVRAWMMARQGRFDDGRADFQAAERACPEESKSLHYKARRAVFELKAGASQRAEELITEAQAGLPEAAALWLALLIEAIRYELSATDRGRFDALWTKAQCLRQRSVTAGALARLMGAFVDGDVKYEGRELHMRQVVEYLRRASRLKYSQADLIAVCRFLAAFPAERELQAKMVARGMKLFPQAVAFLVMAGANELNKGPRGGGRILLARGYYQRALALAEKSKDPEERKLVPAIQQNLSIINELVERAMGFPFGAFGAGSRRPRGMPPGLDALFEAMREQLDADGAVLFPDLDDDEYDDDFDDEYDEEFEEEEAPAKPAPGRRRGPGRAQKGKKKG